MDNPDRLHRPGHHGLPDGGAGFSRRDIPLIVYTRTKSKASRLIGRGSRGSPIRPPRWPPRANVVFICVTDTPDVEAVVRGDDGHRGSGSQRTDRRRSFDDLAHGDAAKWPTSWPSKARIFSMPRSAAATSGPGTARSPSWSAATPAAFERVEPILRYSGKPSPTAAPAVRGQLTKLVNQILVSVTNLAVCEALTFARKHGLDLEKTIAAPVGGAAGSWQLANLGPRMIAGDFRPGFTINLQQKDLRLVLQAAEESNTSLPTASLAHQLFTAAQAAGHGRDGTQALFLVIEKLASLH